MKFTWFNLMPWPHLPDDFREENRSVWVDIPQSLYDPKVGNRVYHEYMDQLEYADALGFGALALVVIFAVSDVVLAYLPPRLISSLKFELAVGAFDLVLVALGIHLHNTRNAGIVNAYAALNAGVDVIDASTGGAGGCPFVPEATGNIPMEDLVFLLEGMGVPTGVNVQKLIETAQWLEGALGRTLPGMVMKAGNCWASLPRTA